MSKKHPDLYENVTPLPPVWLVAPFLRPKIEAMNEQRQREAFVATRDIDALLPARD
ncbi:MULTISPECIES: hypothetical protein [unclassified Sphingomonas]|uniref:hypothetical protein n=1 Tax=unclassified Sphingomonas TaxID=196159 RepID=UPI000AA81EA4|nr:MULTISPECIES: hypothetical protein [unclassified Sphingomonas]